VSVRSTPGCGATFTLHLPVHLSASAAADWEAAKLAWRQRADAASSAPPRTPMPPADAPSPSSLQGGTATRPPPLLLPSGASLIPDDADALLLGGIKRTRSPLPPFTPPPAPLVAARGGQDAPAAQLRCLLAEDHALNLKLVKRLLEQSAQFSVEPAVNGKEAYDKLVAAFEIGEPPHIAVLDMQARGCAGYLHVCVFVLTCCTCCCCCCCACASDAGDVGTRRVTVHAAASAPALKP
jgi:hypothetical protein